MQLPILRSSRNFAVRARGGGCRTAGAAGRRLSPPLPGKSPALLRAGTAPPVRAQRSRSAPLRRGWPAAPPGVRGTRPTGAPRPHLERAGSSRPPSPPPTPKLRTPAHAPSPPSPATGTSLSRPLPGTFPRRRLRRRSPAPHREGRRGWVGGWSPTPAHSPHGSPGAAATARSIPCCRRQAGAGAAGPYIPGTPAPARVRGAGG